MKEITSVDIATEFAKPMAIAGLEKFADPREIDNGKNDAFVLSILSGIRTRMEYLMEVMEYGEIIAQPLLTQTRKILT